MTLKKKILLILLMAFFVFASLNYAIHHYIILPGFEKLELSEATKDMERSVRVIKDEIEHVDHLCLDWSLRGELCTFIESPASGFETENLNRGALVHNWLSLVGIIDISGKVLLCEVWDFPGKGKRVLASLPGQLFSVAGFFLSSLKDKEALYGENITGVFNSEMGPILVSVRPVPDRKKQGRAIGAVIHGRLLDKAFIKLLSEQVEVPFRLIDIKDGLLIGEEKTIAGKLEAEEVHIVERDDNDCLFAYSRLETIGGGPGFLLRADIPRYILEKGRSTFTYSFILITVLGFLVAIFIILLLRVIVIAPVMAISKHVLAVAKTGNFSSRISFSTNDEIAMLAEEVNRMLEKIETQTAELAGINEVLKSDIEKRKQIEQELRDSEERFRRLHEASSGGIFIHDQGRIIDVNQGLSIMTGYSSSELIGMDGFKLIKPLWVKTVKENIAKGYEEPYDIEGVRKDGSVYPIEIQGRNIPYKGQTVRVAELRDVTVRKDMEQRLKNTLDELNAIIENSQVGIMALRGGRILYKGNQRLADILGYESPEDMVGFSMKELHLSEASFIDFGEKHFNRLIHGEQIQVEYQLARRDGTPVWCTLSGKAIDHSSSPDLEKGVVWMIDDITEKRQDQEKLRHLATTDYLTGLLSRMRFMEIAAVELERQRRYSYCGLSLIMLDIDYFKSINDKYGHGTGDDVLKVFAAVGIKNLRDVDIFARIGGEEFVVLLPDTDLTGALAIAERFRASVERISVKTDKGDIRFTISLGVSIWTASIQRIETMLKNADSALYEAKEKGRNRVVIYEENY